jgi:hypothetical protein
MVVRMARDVVRCSTRHAVGVVVHDFGLSLDDTIVESLVHYVVRDEEVGFGVEELYHIRLMEVGSISMGLENPNTSDHLLNDLYL